MKNSKKTWGILGTSMGSMLIIVALLTMVGVGSSDTYATQECTCASNQTKRGTDCFNGGTYVGTCNCPTGYLVSGGMCVKQQSSSSSSDQTNPTFYCEPGTYHRDTNVCIDCPEDSYCPGGNFNYYGQMEGKYECPQNNKLCTSTGFTCKEGFSEVGDKCVPIDETTKTTCAEGTYYDGNNSCLKCTAGFYCPGGTFSHSTGDINGSGRKNCPANTTTCTSTGFTCGDGYYKNSSGTACYKNGTTDCPAGQYYDGSSGCKLCNAGFYCPGGSYSHETGDIDGSGQKTCPIGATCDGTSYKCPSNTHISGNACVKNTTGGDDDDDKPSNPTKPSGGDDKPSNPTTPTGGGDGGSGGNGGNSGGNSGGNGNGGNTGGNNGNNNGGNNTTKNPNTATKAPLVIAIIGIMSVGISSVVYFKGKKEINTEI